MPPRSLEALVNRQLLRWGSAERARAEAAHVSGPSIAISKLPYSGGDEIGRQLAARLDYGVFGREIIDQIEREQGVQHRLLEGLDERIHGVIERYVIDVVSRGAFSESRYLNHLVRTVRTLAERGMVVILGRGATHILSPERTLRVLVVAPAEVRAERLAKAQGISTKEADVQLAGEDRQRREFLRHHFGVTHDDPLDYDVTLNTGSLSLEVGVAIALEALCDRFPDARAAATGSR